MNRFLAPLRDESGGAIMEFVVLALPLFLPLFLYIGLYSESSDTQSSLTTLSREMARAFVTSENDSIADRATYEVFIKGANILGFGKDLNRNLLSYRYACSASPCISPNSRVVIFLRHNSLPREVKAVEYVSPWA